MSLRALLTHRCTVKRGETTVVDGVAAYTWKIVKTGVRCRVDLTFIRMGKDPQWSPEAGRSPDRTGVAFFFPDAPVKVGYRFTMTAGGIEGTFEIQDIDHTQGTRRTHHLECGIQEVPGPIARAAS
jgi:hypothetical protein